MYVLEKSCGILVFIYCLLYGTQLCRFEFRGLVAAIKEQTTAAAVAQGHMPIYFYVFIAFTTAPAGTWGHVSCRLDIYFIQLKTP